MPAAGAQQGHGSPLLLEQLQVWILGTPEPQKKIEYVLKKKNEFSSKLGVRPKEKGNFPSTLRNLPPVGVVVNVKVEPPSWPLHLPEGALRLAKALQKEQLLNRNWGHWFWEAGGFWGSAQRPSVYEAQKHLH